MNSIVTLSIITNDNVNYEIMVFMYTKSCNLPNIIDNTEYPYIRSNLTEQQVNIVISQLIRVTNNYKPTQV